MDISDKTRTEARDCMARDFPAMARALIAMDIGGTLAHRHRFSTNSRYSHARRRILAGEDEAAVRAEIGAAIRDQLAEQRRAADAAWQTFLADWNAQPVLEAAE